MVCCCFVPLAINCDTRLTILLFVGQAATSCIDSETVVLTMGILRSRACIMMGNAMHGLPDLGDCYMQPSFVLSLLGYFALDAPY